MWDSIADTCAYTVDWIIAGELKGIRGEKMIYQFKADIVQAKKRMDISLIPNKRLYCFIGENGIGKTVLLENMARSLLYSHSFFSQKKPEGESNSTFTGLIRQQKIVKVLDKEYLFLPMDIQINESVIKGTDQAWGSTTIETLQQNPQRIALCDLPIVFIGAKNRGYTNNLDVNCIKLLGSSIQRFLESFLENFQAMHGEPNNIDSVSDWITARLIINNNFVRGNDSREHEVIALLRLIDKLEPTLHLVNNNAQGGVLLRVIFRDGELCINDVPINKLPTGHIAIIKLFQAIISGFGAWRGIVGQTNVLDSEGIVFIDEIEAHLHPRWQQRIISILKDSFPKATFYIATHSPTIISSTDNDEAYELKTDENNTVIAKSLGSPKFWYCADVLEQAFHLTLQNSIETEIMEKDIFLFNQMVQEYLMKCNEGDKEKIKSLFEIIVSRMALEDPRKEAVEYLMGQIK